MMTPTFWQAGPVLVEVSPCSWMYPNYGLQLRVSLSSSACNAESEFLHDKSLLWEQATRADADRMVADFMANGGLEKLHANVANWAKQSAAFEKEMEAENKREAARIKRLDAKYRKQGFTHRVDAWIHPSRGGDDYQISFYSSGLPSKTLIGEKLRRSGSRVTDDYVVTALDAVLS